MFTGIIETLGTITETGTRGSNTTFWIESNLAPELRPDQSVAHDGVCLTVEAVQDGRHRVTAIAETLEKTALRSWQPGRIVNLERCLPANGRFDGHFVQGHVDTTGTCTKVRDRDGSREYTFRFPKKFAHLMVEKGSITVNGISLTAFDLGKNSFRVAIIPYTLQHTNLGGLAEGEPVNLEFDLLGKYIHRKLSLKA